MKKRRREEETKGLRERRDKGLRERRDKGLRERRDKETEEKRRTDKEKEWNNKTIKERTGEQGRDAQKNQSEKRRHRRAGGRLKAQERFRLFYLFLEKYFI